jgi:fumarate hydratase subunit beta
MSTEYKFETPLTEEQVRMLKLGDLVYFDGEIVLMAGVPTFERILKFSEQGEKPPVTLENSVVFHGVNFNREVDGKYEMLYFGPTTSTRFEPYTPSFIRKFKVRALVGKGGLGKQSLEAMKEVGCVYLSVVGGGVPLLSLAIREVTSVNWTDLIPHYRLITVKVEKFGPAIVAMDSHGNSIYEQTKKRAEEKLPDILKKLQEMR